jgi:predicted small metal-binding protein
MSKVADHVRKVHKVNQPTETITSYVKQKIRR